jgi:hypothetical protein
MTEAVTINDQELAILCDIVGGWSVKWAENLDVDKRQALDRLIANGFVERANGHPVTTINTPPKPSCFSPSSALA